MYVIDEVNEMRKMDMYFVYVICTLDALFAHHDVNLNTVVFSFF